MSISLEVILFTYDREGMVLHSPCQLHLDSEFHRCKFGRHHKVLRSQLHLHLDFEGHHCMMLEKKYNSIHKLK